MNNDIIFNKIAEALLIDYSRVYYVNAETNEYQWYSIDMESHSRRVEQGGKDFFEHIAQDAEQVVYEEDRHIFQTDIRKEKLLSEMKKGTMQSLQYRLVINGKPVYHTLRLIRGVSGEDDYFILGVLNIDKEVRMRQEAQKLERDRENFNQIAGSLAEHYDTLYYIDVETSHYFEFSSTDTYKNLQVPTEGDDFFAESRRNIKKYVHPEDQDKVLKIHYKEVMLENLKYKNSFSITYRLIVAGSIMHCRHSEIWASDRKHLIVCIENINAEVAAEKALKESQKKSVTYGQIAESLASHYDVIYYVDSTDSGYVGFTSNAIYGNLEIQEEGTDFFAESQSNAEQLLHTEDKERILGILERDHFISALEGKKRYSTDYRLMIDGKPQHTRLTVMWSSDKTHFIIGVENIDEEVRKEKEHMRALKSAKEMARRDELTGIKNKNAYQELEKAIQKNLDSGMDYLPFGIAVCDLNNLKRINDTLGHKAGDEYIKAACKMICDIFAHSPVFRIGGDEFAILLSERDYADRENLLEKFRRQVLDNQKKGEAPVVAIGMAAYVPETDCTVSDVFERADSMMYEDKKRLKEEK